MYPNFHAEQHKHHVQENSSMAVARKRRESSSRSDSTASSGSGRPPSRNAVPELRKHFSSRYNEDVLTSRKSKAAHPRADQPGIPLIAPNPSSNQLEAATPSVRPPSRHTAIRGELSLVHPAAWEHDNASGGSVGVSPRLRPLVLAPTLADSATSLLEASAGGLSVAESESLQDLVINARPRVRYARRELYRQGSAPSLERISTAPATLPGRCLLDNTTARDTSMLTTSRSAGALQSARMTARLNQRPPSRQAFQSLAVDTVEAVFPGADVDEPDDDDTNVFLTELEAAARAASAAAAARLSTLARHIALGSFLLYGNPPAHVAAIHHFTEALKTVESAQNERDPDWPALALASLLHHHRGVALREIVVAAASTHTKPAAACVKHAFAAQRRALELAQRANDLRLQARAVKTLGLLLLDAHSYAPALTHQQEALQHALEEKDRELEARVYANLGNLALAQLQFGHALSCHKRDLDLCSSKALDCRLGRARAHRNLSIVFAKLHQREQQIKHEREAREAEHKDGGAYLYDVATHSDNSVGNICLQSSTPIDPALVHRVAQDLQEIVRGLSAKLQNDATTHNTDGDSIMAALEQEWQSTEIDLEAAVAALGDNGDTLASRRELKSLLASPTAGNSRHVTIQVNLYGSAASLPQPAPPNHGP